MVGVAGVAGMVGVGGFVEVVLGVRTERKCRAVVSGSGKWCLEVVSGAADVDQRLENQKEYKLEVFSQKKHLFWNASLFFVT